MSPYILEAHNREIQKLRQENDKLKEDLDIAYEATITLIEEIEELEESNEALQEQVIDLSEANKIIYERSYQTAQNEGYATELSNLHKANQSLRAECLLLERKLAEIRMIV